MVDRQKNKQDPVRRDSCDNVSTSVESGNIFHWVALLNEYFGTTLHWYVGFFSRLSGGSPSLESLDHTFLELIRYFRLTLWTRVVVMNVHNETVMTMSHSTFLNTRRRGKGFWQLPISRAISYPSFRIGAAILNGLSTNHRWSDSSRLVRGYLLVTKWASYSQVFVVPTYRDYIHFLFKINLKITWIFMSFKELYLLPTFQK